MDKINKFWVIAAIVVVNSFLTSCTKNEFNNQKEDKKVDLEERSNTNEVLVNFLELIDDHYVLSITKNEAKKLGISEESYLKTLKEIENTNISLDSLRNKGIEVELTDPKKAVKARVETKYITGTMGTLTTNDRYAVTSSISVAQGIKSFEFYCTHNSKEILVYYICKVAPGGGMWETRSQSGIYGTETLVFVPYRIFSQNALISFSTNDLRGGRAHYFGSLIE